MSFKDPAVQKAYLSKHYLDNKPKYQRSRSSGVAVRAYLVQNLKRKTPCAVCGLIDAACLCFHHKDPRLKLNSIPKLIDDRCVLAKIKNELKKCIPLCANDHMRVHHGTLKVKHIPTITDDQLDRAGF